MLVSKDGLFPDEKLSYRVPFTYIFNKTGTYHFTVKDIPEMNVYDPGELKSLLPCPKSYWFTKYPALQKRGISTRKPGFFLFIPELADFSV